MRCSGATSAPEVVVREVRTNRRVPCVPSDESLGVVNRDAGVAAELGMSLIVRTSGRPEAIVPAVRAAVLEINPIVAFFNAKPMAEVVADSLWELNLYRWLIGLFAMLALTLATPRTTTIQIKLAEIKGSFVANYQLQMAAAVISRRLARRRFRLMRER